MSNDERAIPKTILPHPKRQDYRLQLNKALEEILRHLNGSLNEGGYAIGGGLLDHPELLIVSSKGTKYDNLPDALTDAGSGDTIWILPGTYTLTAADTIPDGVDIVNLSNRQVIITGNLSTYLLQINGTNSFFNIDFRNTNTGATSRVFDIAGNSTTHFFNCSFSSSYYGNIFYDNGGNLTNYLHNCSASGIVFSYIDNSTHNHYLYGKTTFTFVNSFTDNCYIMETGGTGGGAMYAYSGAKVSWEDDGFETEYKFTNDTTDCKFYCYGTVGFYDNVDINQTNEPQQITHSKTSIGTLISQMDSAISVTGYNSLYGTQKDIGQLLAFNCIADHTGASLDERAWIYETDASTNPCYIWDDNYT